MKLPLPRSGFFSLKWKLLLLLSVALLSVNGVLSLLAYNDLISRFESQRALVRERHLVEARALQSDAVQHIQQQTDVLASIIGLSGFSDPVRLDAAVDAYWTSLQLSLVMDSLRLYDRNGQLLAQWSNTRTDYARESGLVRAVLGQEQPVAWLDCQSECLQSAATPILSQGKLAGVVVVSGSLADMIVSFRNLTGADIGLLAPGLAGARPLPKLGMSVAGLSGREQNLPLLDGLVGIPQEQAGRRWVKITQDGRKYDLTFQSLDEHPGAKPSPMLVIIEDVSADYASIRSQAIRQMGGEVLTSLLALMLLAFLLRAPLRRMTQAAEAIPLLGQRAFAEVRNRIRPRSGLAFKDEVDHLDQAAVTLSYRLENLEQEVQKHADSMQAMLKTISIEHAFNDRLLDTAQVIILTQNGDGRIQTVNRYCEMLTGWSEAEIKGKSFFEMICRIRLSGAEMAQVVHDVASGREEHIYRECVLLSRNGTEREIAWNHSRLAGEPGAAAQVLSVGLDITERKQAEKRIVWLAEHDQLTGLANRQVFQRDLEQALAMTRRTGREGALLYIDLDGFKYVNDVSGHQAGDALLRAVAEEIRVLVRETDQLARLGGDELGILLRDCDLEGAGEVAEKINRQLAAINFPGLGANHRISASIGVVMFPRDDMDVKQMMASADIAMYQAKAAGRGCWHLYAEGERMQEKLQRWVYWEEKIKTALEHDGFTMHYQPILDIRSNAISHYEALIRMKAEDGSLIAPGEFMEVAEKCGLIREIDRHVVRAVIDRLLQMLAAGATCKMAVNLSGVSINDDGLLDFLHKELARSPLLSQHLIFEITETAAVADFSAARTFMQAVRELGCVFSLDDFGVGFSSFYYVKHLPVDYVKIDGSFIRTLADSPDDQVFVRALAEVARGFGKKTVAEFVEDDRILALLRAFGVDYAQGYFIGKPSERTDL